MHAAHETSVIQQFQEGEIKVAHGVNLTHWQYYSSCLSWWIWIERNAVNSNCFSPLIGNKMKQLWPEGVWLHGQCHWVTDWQRQSASHFLFFEWIYVRDFHSQLIVGPVFHTGYSLVWQGFLWCPSRYDDNNNNNKEVNINNDNDDDDSNNNKAGEFCVVGGGLPIYLYMESLL